MGLTIPKDELILFNFTSPELSGQWSTVNDVVMGGMSQSDIMLNSDKTVTFTGHISLENNGGFASVRTNINFFSPKEFKGVLLRIKGDGNIFKLRFRTSDNLDDYAYQTILETKKDIWKEFKIAFNDFIPVFRGRTLKNKPVLASNHITQVGILISDKQAGDFKITLAWIKLYN